jgi:hypothetical protein
MWLFFTGTPTSQTYNPQPDQKAEKAGLQKDAHQQPQSEAN